MSYKVYRVGHPNVSTLFTEPTIVQEKIDGSYFEFGLRHADGLLRPYCCSKNMDLSLHSRDSARFYPGIQHALKALKKLKQEPITFYCEYLDRPRHNVIRYKRIPKNHLILFDVKTNQGWCTQSQLIQFASILDIEAIPVFDSLFVDGIPSDLALNEYLAIESILGGDIEGIVIKQLRAYERVIAKHVSSRFKEVANIPKSKKPKSTHQLEDIIQSLRTTARWEKAVYRLRDQNLLTNTNKDIGLIHKEIHQDIWEEEQQYITEALLKIFKKEILKGACVGVSEWYAKHKGNF